MNKQQSTLTGLISSNALTKTKPIHIDRLTLRLEQFNNHEEIMRKPKKTQIVEIQEEK